LTTAVGHAILPLTLHILTTKPLRLLLPLVVSLAWTPAAHAWSWPVQGPVLEPFSYDEAHPYAAGQHRGIDIGADAAGETVVAPVGGTVGFAGTVPTSGKSVTIETADGYSVTLTHLGSITVAKGATIAERGTIGTIGPSDTAEVEGPYVHLGIRHAADPNGYVDPLGLLPAPSSGAADSGSPAPQPSSNGASPVVSTSPPSAPSVPSVPTPASAATSSSRPASSTPTTSRGSAHGDSRSRSDRPREDSGQRRPDVRTTPSSRRRPEGVGVEAGPRVRRHARASQPRSNAPTSSSRRPVVEPAAQDGATGLDAGYERDRNAPVEPRSPSRGRSSSALTPLFLNGAAALVALSAALAAARTTRLRRRSDTSPGGCGQVLHLPGRTIEPRAASRAA
jgi:Peptidase family M23